MTAAESDLADRVEKTVRTNGSDLLGYFLRRVENADAAADLLGELFVVIWRRKGDLPAEPERARMWCFGIARNVLREHRRGQTRRLALADSLRAHLDLTTQRLVADPVESAERSEESARLHRALRGLDERSRELVVLIHWDGFSIADAAEFLGVNASTARTRYARARDALAAALGPPSQRRPTDRAPDEGKKRAALRIDGRWDVVVEGGRD